MLRAVFPGKTLSTFLYAHQTWGHSAPGRGLWCSCTSEAVLPPHYTGGAGQATMHTGPRFVLYLHKRQVTISRDFSSSQESKTESSTSQHTWLLLSSPSEDLLIHVSAPPYRTCLALSRHVNSEGSATLLLSDYHLLVIGLISPRGHPPSTRGSISSLCCFSSVPGTWHRGGKG